MLLPSPFSFPAVQTMFLPLCIGFSSPSSLPMTVHLLTSLPHPSYSLQATSHPYTFLWPCRLLWHLQVSDSYLHNFRPTPYIVVIFSNRPPNLWTSTQLLFLLQIIPAYSLPLWSSLALITLHCVLLSPTGYRRVLLVPYSFLFLLPLGLYIVYAGRSWLHYCQMISVPCKVLIGVTLGYCINNTNLTIPLWWEGLKPATSSKSNLSFVSIMPGRKPHLSKNERRLMYRKKAVMFLLSSTKNAHQKNVPGWKRNSVGIIGSSV